MPVAPTFYSADQPITAKQLNTDLYTYTPGDNHSPNGILFHGNRPAYVASIFSNEGSSVTLTSGGEYQLVASTEASGGGGYSWNNFFDNSCLFGPGGDNPYLSSTGAFRANVPGSFGYQDVTGGIYLAWAFSAIEGLSEGGAFGAGLFVNAPNSLANSFTPPPAAIVPGGLQSCSVAEHSCAYILDAYSAVTNSPNTTTSAYVFGYGSGEGTIVANASDYSGEGTRLYAAWVSTVNGSAVSSLPVPLSSYGTGSTISSAFLNSGSGIGGPLTFLNYPPVLRASHSIGSTIPATTATVVSFSGGSAIGQQIDTYLGFTGTSYTVRIPGVYLCHGALAWSSFTTAAQMATGIRVGTVTMWGPPYQQSTAAANITSLATWMADLEAGDSVSLVAYTTAGTTLSSSQFTPSRFVMSWMGSLGSPSTSWTPPATGFRWTAGAGSLATLFNDHLANDLSFLMQRPYLLSYQTPAGSQTGFTAGSWSTIHMNTVAGFVHGTVGDNYGAFNGTSYVAPVNGWYLATCGYTLLGASATCYPIAGLLQSPAGAFSPDWYQHMYSTSSTLHPGAEGMGLYYLRAGDTLTPQANLQSAGTWGTSFNIGTAAGNHFELVWLSE